VSDAHCRAVTDWSSISIRDPSREGQTALDASETARHFAHKDAWLVLMGLGDREPEEFVPIHQLREQEPGRARTGPLGTKGPCPTALSHTLGDTVGGRCHDAGIEALRGSSEHSSADRWA